MVLIGGISVIALKIGSETTPPIIRPKKHSRRPTKTRYRWRSRRRDLGSGARGLLLPEQGRRVRRQHQYGAGGRLPRLRLLLDHFRDRRFREKARARSVRAAPPQYDLRLMTGSNRSGVTPRMLISAAMGWTRAWISSNARSERARRAQAGREPVLHSPCWNAA